jgi:ABC-type Fe3+-citrate transport system substrate-binding protein
MLIKEVSKQCEYITDKEGDLYISDKKEKAKILKLLKIIPDTELFQIVRFNNTIGIQTEYEIAWLNENNKDGLDEKRMQTFEKRCLNLLPKLKSQYPNILFYLSRTKDNINNALIIHAFMTEELYQENMFDIIYDFYTKNDKLYCCI